MRLGEGLRRQAAEKLVLLNTERRRRQTRGDFEGKYLMQAGFALTAGQEAAGLIARSDRGFEFKLFSRALTEEKRLTLAAEARRINRAEATHEAALRYFGPSKTEPDPNFDQIVATRIDNVASKLGLFKALRIKRRIEQASRERRIIEGRYGEPKL